MLKKNGDDAGHKEALKKNETLANEAARLRQNIDKAWKGAAATVIADIRASSGKLQSQISDIEKQIGTAQKVVKALGYVDDLIAIARAVVGAIA